MILEKMSHPKVTTAIGARISFPASDPAHIMSGNNAIQLVRTVINTGTTLSNDHLIISVRSNGIHSFIRLR